MKTVAPILFNNIVKKDNPDKIPVPNKEPEIIPPKEPQPDIWPRKEPEIQPEKEPATTPPLPPQIPYPEQTFITSKGDRKRDIWPTSK